MALPDLFEKARKHERLEQLKAAREQDLLPYFREVDGEPGPLAHALVVGRLPGLLDKGFAVEALDQHASLLVHGEVHRTDHAVAPALAQPTRCRIEQGVEDLLVLFGLEEAELAPVVALV